MTKIKTYGQVIGVRVDQNIFDWWEAKCKKQGLKKGEPLKKALELSYQKENDPEYSGQDFSLHLENDLAEKIYSLAQAEKQDPNELIADLLRERIAEREKVKDTIDVFEKTTRKELRIKPSLKKKIDERAALSKMKPNQYILSVLTANVTKDAHFFGQEEALLLGRSNGELLALGRNLNQMAKAMNQGVYEAYDRDFVGRIHELIRAHVHHVYKLLVQNQKRWA